MPLLMPTYQFPHYQINWVKVGWRSVQMYHSLYVTVNHLCSITCIFLHTVHYPVNFTLYNLRHKMSMLLCFMKSHKISNGTSFSATCISMPIIITIMKNSCSSLPGSSMAFPLVFPLGLALLFAAAVFLSNIRLFPPPVLL